MKADVRVRDHSGTLAQASAGVFGGLRGRRPNGSTDMARGPQEKSAALTDRGARARGGTTSTVRVCWHGYPHPVPSGSKTVNRAASPG